LPGITSNEEPVSRVPDLESSSGSSGPESVMPATEIWIPVAIQQVMV
jgi:predicted transcriptional regulator YdeE